MPKTVAEVTHTLFETSSAMWKVYWELHPAAVRFLTEEQTKQLHALHVALHEAAMKLAGEGKPQGWRKGMKVRITKATNGVRSICPVPGTIGKVDRVMQNEYGWWVCVALTGDVTDVDGTVWQLGNEPAVNWFKPDEIERVNKSKTK